MATQPINNKSASFSACTFCIKNHTKTPGRIGAMKPIAHPFQTVSLIAFILSIILA